MAAERETIDRLIAHHLADRIGATFEGQISGVTRRRVSSSSSTRPAPTVSCPAATIGADYYRYDEANHALVGERTGETYRLGDRVEVKLVEAAPVAGALRFELLVRRHARTGKARRGRRRAAQPPDRGTKPKRRTTPRVKEGAAGRRA